MKIIVFVPVLAVFQIVISAKHRLTLPNIVGVEDPVPIVRPGGPAHRVYGVVLQAKKSSVHGALHASALTGNLLFAC